MFQIVFFILIIGFQLFLNYLVLAGDNKKKPTNMWFVAMNLSILIWIITILIANNNFENQRVTVFVSQLSFASIYMFTFFLYVFSTWFSNTKGTFLKIINYLQYALVVFWLIAIFFSDGIVEGILRVDQRNDIIRGRLYLPYLISILFNIFLSILILILIRKNTNKIEILRRRWMSVGLFLVTLFVIFTNAIIPILTGTTESSNYGPLGIIIWLYAISYLIRKYNFLNARLVIGRIVYFLLVSSIAYITYYGIYFIDVFLFDSVLSAEALVLGIANAVLFTIIFNYSNNYIRTQVNTRLINPGYNPLTTIDKLSRNLATLLSIEDIVDQTLDTLSKTLRANYEAILIYPENQKEKLFFQTRKQSKEFDSGVAKTLVKIWNKTGKAVIDVDTIKEKLPRSLQMYEKEIWQIGDYLKEQNIKLLVPLKQGDNTLGFILLGQKEADSPYTSIDVEFIQGIASNVGLAVARSLYYIEVQDLNRNLQRKVDEATKDLAVKNTRLEKALKRLEEIRRQERDMVDVMGHELRTPITIVRNALLVLKSKLDENEDIPRSKLVDYINKSVESTKREITLVETLLSATKVEANRIQLHFTKVDMLDVIRDGIEGQKAFAKQRDIKVKFDKPKKGYFAYCDRTRIQEIMDNFLSNAIKYTVRGHVDILISQDKQMVSIAVKDTGIGISKEDLEKLGRKFFRAKQYVDSHEPSKPGVTRPGGTGLGLYVSFNMIRIMNGKFNVESKLGKGSTFTFSMPLYTGQPDKDFDQTFEQEEI